MDIVKKGGLGLIPQMIAGGKPSLPLGMLGVGVQALTDNDKKKKKPVLRPPTQPAVLSTGMSGGGALSAVNPIKTVYK